MSATDIPDFKIDDLTPIEPTTRVSPTGSYSAESIKVTYNYKFKNHVTKNDVVTSGVLGSEVGNSY